MPSAPPPATEPMSNPSAMPSISLHAERRGQGPTPLVLLHGWALNLRVFDRLVAQLEQDFTVIALDLPGHGRSAEPAALAHAGWTLEQLAAHVAPQVPPGSTVLGWSLGGQLALQLARIAPERVAALALVATTPRFVAAPDWPHGIAPTVLEQFATHLGSDYQATVHDFLELQVRGSRAAAATLAALHAALLAHGAAPAAVLARSLELLRTADLRAALPTIDVPALVIGGQYDRVTPPTAARALAAALPRACHHELTRCGHAPFLTHEAEVGALLRDFTARAALATTRR